MNRSSTGYSCEFTVRGFSIHRLLQFSALDPNLRREFADAGVYRVVVKVSPRIYS